MPPSPYSLLSLLALPAAAATRLLASFFFSAACLCHDSAAERACESLTFAQPAGGLYSHAGRW